MSAPFRIPTVLSALLLSVSAAAFDLADAAAAAKKHSAEYEAAVYGRDAELEKPAQARSALLPQISVNASHRRQPQSVSANTRSTGWEIQAEQSLFDKGRWLQYRQGKLAAQSAELQLRQTGSELNLKVAQAYFDLLSAREQLTAVRAERQAFERQLEQSEAMFQSGAATRIDIQEAMSGYDTAVAKEMAVLNRLQLARAALADLTGLDASQAEAPDFPASLPNMLEGKPQEYWQQSAAEHNPELARQKLAAETARLALDETKARRLPRITAAAGYQNYHNRQEYGGSSQNYRSKGAVLSVQLTLPLFNGGQTASQSREAAARLNQTDALLTAAEQKVRREINRYYLDAVGQWYQAKAQQRLLETNRAKFQAALKGRELGLSTTLQVIQARQAESEAQQKLAEARFAYLSAYAGLLHHAGLLDGGTALEDFVRLKGIAVSAKKGAHRPAPAAKPAERPAPMPKRRQGAAAPSARHATKKPVGVSARVVR